MKKYFLFTIIGLLLISCGGPDKESSSDEIAAEVKDSNIAPDFTLLDLNGQAHTLSDYRGKVVIIDFWATFCRPCIYEIPHFIQFYNEYKDDGLVILGVGLDGKQKLEVFAREKGMSYPVLIGDKATVEKYGIQPIPTTFILDREGEIKDKIIGYAPGYENTIKAKFLELL